MSAAEAIARLLEIAKDGIRVVDGEWGCCHSYEEALTGQREREEWHDEDEDLTVHCSMHDEAVEISKLEEAVADLLAVAS